MFFTYQEAVKVCPLLVVVFFVQ